MHPARCGVYGVCVVGVWWVCLGCVVGVSWVCGGETCLPPGLVQLKAEKKAVAEAEIASTSGSEGEEEEWEEEEGEESDAGEPSGEQPTRMVCCF